MSESQNIVLLTSAGERYVSCGSFGPCGDYYCQRYGCQRSARCRQTYNTPGVSIAEQMGVDPISKLAEAIEKLAGALNAAVENQTISKANP